jgi:periplasmic protein TonB
MGLTESAVEAIQQWKFKPGTKNGKEVAVAVNIEINFNLGKKK